MPVRPLVGALALGLSVWLVWPVVSAQERGAANAILMATSANDVRQWDALVGRMIRDGELRWRRRQDDTMLPGYVHDRYIQHHRGVPVFGGDISRHEVRGAPDSIFGRLYLDIDLDTTPKLTPDEARERAVRHLGEGANTLSAPELVVLPRDDGGYVLTYLLRAAVPGDVLVLFLNASTGAEELRYSDLQTQAAVGRGKGVYGDDKKVSAQALGGAYVADDKLRPPVLRTYDLKGNLSRAKSILFYGVPFLTSDLASDSDNDWADGANVDAHTYLGWTYDYYFKRFNRRGLDGSDHTILAMTHMVSQQGAISLPPSDLDYALNAFWCGSCGGGGVMAFGDGIPPNYYLASSGQNVTYLAGAPDIVAHELTHGLTEHTSNLIYRNESGALNEAFSDILGASVEFYYQPAGNGSLRADYLIGEDAFVASRTGSVSGSRSMADPAAYGDPDHYSRRYIGPEDNGGVHRNSGIANNAFYLAVEGGTNRTSGLSVQGVGAANREQIEKAFYRAFVYMLTSNATFFMAREAAIQAARELYGASSAAERAVTQAWDAVGVRRQAALQVSFSPDPVPPARAGACNFPSPNFAFTTTVSEVNGVGFTVNSSSISFYDGSGRFLNTQPLSFVQYFAACGPSSSRINAYGRACANLCVYLAGRSGGFVDFTFSGTDDLGNQLTFKSSPVTLGTVGAASQTDVVVGACAVGSR